MRLKTGLRHMVVVKICLILQDQGRWLKQLGSLGTGLLHILYMVVAKTRLTALEGVSQALP